MHTAFSSSTSFWALCTSLRIPFDSCWYRQCHMAIISTSFAHICRPSDITYFLIAASVNLSLLCTQLCIALHSPYIQYVEPLCSQLSLQGSISFLLHIFDSSIVFQCHSCQIALFYIMFRYSGEMFGYIFRGFDGIICGLISVRKDGLLVTSSIDQDDA